MSNTNDKDRTNKMETAGHSRRGFMVSAATAVAGVSAANLLNLQTANAAITNNVVAIGNGPYPVEGMAAYSPAGPHRPMKFQRRTLGPKDVAIKIHYCGVCHSDIHTIRGDWGKIQYPQIVGHELAGEVVAVGSSASKFNVGARVGVGTMVNSCRVCTECQAGHESYCLNGNTQAYGSKDRDGTITQGGYSTFVVVDEDFVINIPAAIDLAEAGPLMCAGITVYSPLLRWGVSAGKKVAIVGMGGLGHLAVKIATALGAEVTVFTTSPDKVEDARRFGAKDVVINKEGADFSRFKHAFDFALDTVPYKHDLNRFIPLLKRDATYCRVGVGNVVDSNEIGQMNLVLYRNSLAGSNTGGIKETQDMIDFCALNKIKPEITKILMNGIDDAWTKVIEKKARYRYVMDMKA
ncbi:NAD(P)-dependent alcohol dehydrogenase [Candidatus Nitrotoga arctica]|uniref:Aldehyde reductase, NADPH-dependent n=1 Tax=Candidatus Nitrotoga arctica TaxID=453162 RepID=A0ABM8YZF7_9PROT|nr:NAD(P)-dependent alcohol dehydrogenase [Candidatus Nitrotoga arctica]CAG9932906.1 aldehyde reductase, NADPH-dependent [Candidatus Nitrotoga arctica]